MQVFAHAQRWFGNAKLAAYKLLSSAIATMHSIPIVHDNPAQDLYSLLAFPAHPVSW